MMYEMKCTKCPFRKYVAFKVSEDYVCDQCSTTQTTLWWFDK